MEQDTLPARLMSRSGRAVPERHTAYRAAARHEDPALPSFPQPYPLHLTSAPNSLPRLVIELLCNWPVLFFKNPPLKRSQTKKERSALHEDSSCCTTEQRVVQKRQLQ